MFPMDTIHLVAQLRQNVYLVNRDTQCTVHPEIQKDVFVFHLNMMQRVVLASVSLVTVSQLYVRKKGNVFVILIPEV